MAFRHLNQAKLHLNLAKAKTSANAKACLLLVVVLRRASFWQARSTQNAENLAKAALLHMKRLAFLLRRASLLKTCKRKGLALLRRASFGHRKTPRIPRILRGIERCETARERGNCPRVAKQNVKQCFFVL